MIEFFSFKKCLTFKINKRFLFSITHNMFEFAAPKKASLLNTICVCNTNSVKHCLSSPGKSLLRLEHSLVYQGCSERNLRFTIKKKKAPVKRKLIYYIHLKGTFFSLFFYIVTVQIEALIVTVPNLIDFISVELCCATWPLVPVIHTWH